MFINYYLKDVKEFLPLAVKIVAQSRKQALFQRQTAWYEKYPDSWGLFSHKDIVKFLAFSRSHEHEENQH